MSEKSHISATQLSMYWRCGEQYRRRYIEGERIPPGIALLVGSGFHAGVETNMRQKIQTHEDLPTGEVVDAAVAGFETRISADGYELSGDEKSIGAKKVIGGAIDMTRRLAEVHAAEQAPDYQPLDVERRTLIELPRATHDLLAFTDLRDNLGRITDFKTAGRKKQSTEAEKSIQLTIYAAAYQYDHGALPTSVRLDVVTKTKKPARQVLESMRDRADLEVLVNRVNTTLEAINAGVFTPASPDSWMCSERWCGYARSCPFYRRGNT